MERDTFSAELEQAAAARAFIYAGVKYRNHIFRECTACKTFLKNAKVEPISTTCEVGFRFRMEVEKFHGDLERIVTGQRPKNWSEHGTSPDKN